MASGDDPKGPQSPAGPQAPAPSGFPPPPADPETVGAPQAPGYGGPVPPGGWHQPAVPARPPLPTQGQLASWGSRCGAALIDGLVLAAPGVILFLAIVGGAVGITGTEDDNVALGAAIFAIFAWFLVMAVLFMLYGPLLMMRQGQNNGQTWGKQALGIRVVRDSGQPYDFGSAALREVVVKFLAVAIASSIIFLIPIFLDLLWPLWDDQNRALHDMAASSHVVRA